MQDSACIQAVRSLGHSDGRGPAHFNLVQQALWPETSATPEASEEAPDVTDHPGSWAPANVSKGPAYLPQNGYMAHTMRVGQVLRPVPVPSTDLLKASLTAQVCRPTSFDAGPADVF